LNSSINH